MEALDLIDAKKVQTHKKVIRLRAQLEAAEAELRNLEITAETLTRLNLNPEVDSSVPRGQSASYVFGVLGATQDEGKSPKEIHDALIASGVTTISQDNVRTILSRHRDKFTSNDGRYWRTGDKEIEPSNGAPVDGSETSTLTLAEEAPEW